MDCGLFIFLDFSITNFFFDQACMESRTRLKIYITWIVHFRFRFHLAENCIN